jgi:hypothetical protein
MAAPQAIRVSCPDDDLARWLEAWLGDMRLSPPVPLAIDVRIGAPPDAGRDARPPFLQPTVEIRTGPPADSVGLRWRLGPAAAEIADGEHTARVVLGPAAAADRDRLAQTFLNAVLVFLLRRAGWHHVHAAIARDPGGREWLFAGDAEAGKSTTAALLATHHWAVGSDDLSFLAREGSGVEAIAQRAPIALRSGGHALLGLSGGMPVRGGQKTAYFPEAIGGSWLPRATPTILALPRVAGSVTRVELVRPREALAELIRWSAWVALEPALAQEHLDMLNALARQTRCYRIALGPDLFAGRDLLRELVP